MSKVIGIDLGTTNTVVSAIVNGEPVIIRTTENLDYIPSVVCYDTKYTNQLIVGQQARDMTGDQPENTVYSVKRLMGMLYVDDNLGSGVSLSKDRERFAAAKAKLGYRLAPDPKGHDDRVRVLLGKDCYLTPEEVSSKILIRAREEASRVLGAEVTAAVITVPAYFEDRQIAATKRAGQLAGLNVLQILEEPSAAALASARAGGQRARYVLVYDLGGGTFDVSLLQASTDGSGKEQFVIRALGGNNWLGGDDFDDELIRLAAAHVQSLYGYDPLSDWEFRSKVRPAMEFAKKTLSEHDKAVVNVAGCCCIPISGGGKRLIGINNLVVTRAEFEARISKYVDETLRIVEMVLTGRGGVLKELVDEVLLVGGSTYIPCVRRALEALFPDKVRPVEEVNPMTCVAQGAAIRAERMISDNSPPGTVTPFTLGVAVQRGETADVFAPIIPKGFRMPMSGPLFKTFQATKPNGIFLPVYAGDDSKASRNSHQGNISLDLSRDPIDIGTPVEVGLRLTDDRIVEVVIRIRGRSEIVDRLQCALPDEETWPEDLEQHLAAAQAFVRSYNAYMTAENRDRLERIVARGEVACAEKNRTEGRICTRQIAREILGLDEIANLLFKAERLGHNMDLPAQFRGQLSSVCAVAKRYYLDHAKSNTPETAAKVQEAKKELETATSLAVRHLIVAQHPDYIGVLGWQ